MLRHLRFCAGCFIPILSRLRRAFKFGLINRKSCWDTAFPQCHSYRQHFFDGRSSIY